MLLFRSDHAVFVVQGCGDDYSEAIRDSVNVALALPVRLGVRETLRTTHSPGAASRMEMQSGHLLWIHDMCSFKVGETSCKRDP